MTYEEKMRMMSWVKPEKKDELLLRLVRGETINLHKDEDLFYQVNRDRVSMERQVNRDKYKHIANHMKETRKVLHTVDGKTLQGQFRYKGDIPADIYFTHPWFSPTLPKEERDRNIDRFFKLFPDFSVKGR